MTLSLSERFSYSMARAGELTLRRKLALVTVGLGFMLDLAPAARPPPGPKATPTANQAKLYLTPHPSRPPLTQTLHQAPSPEPA